MSRSPWRCSPSLHALARDAHQERGWRVGDEQFVEVDRAAVITAAGRGKPAHTAAAKGDGTRRRGNWTTGKGTPTDRVATFMCSVFVQSDSTYPASRRFVKAELPGSQNYVCGPNCMLRALEQIGRIHSLSAAAIRSSASKPGTRIPRST